jgi:hypothetical protein
VRDNSGIESVWLTRDAGATWTNATGNLVQATAVVGKARPSALALVDVAELGASALLVGTVSGVFVSWTDDLHVGKWSRLGQCADIPLVRAPVCCSLESARVTSLSQPLAAVYADRQFFLSHL